MTLLSNTITQRVLSTIICTSLAACGGGGADSGSTVAAQSVSSNAAFTKTPAAAPSGATWPAAGASPAAGTPATDSTPSVEPAALTPVTSTDLRKPVTPVVPAVSPTDPASTGTSIFGTYLRPYAANSLWNSRPVNPVFGTYVIPKSSYFPTIASGAYSTGVFLASTTDQPMTVVGPGSGATWTNGVSDPDSGNSRVITLPRWPAGVLPAAGTDGHADIVDPVTKIIHSFWQLKLVNGRWTAAMYAWSKLGGTGWGDPAHYYQGARAVGIPASAGLIRKHEIKDGLAAYPHALAMSLTFNALANGTGNPAYVFPATAADNTAAANSGAIPQGSLLMLPPDFDSSAIVNPDLKKVVETLKLYGAYVVDRNTGTPFVIYVENDAGFNLMPKGWDNTTAGQLDLIRASLRQVTSAQTWVDGNGNTMASANMPQPNMNIVSMRGGWYRQSGTGTAAYDPIEQRFLFDATTTKTVYVNANNNGLTPVNWAKPQAGTYVKFSVTATGGARLRLQVKSGDTFTYDTWDMVDGKSVRILWPEKATIVLIASSGTTGPSSVKAELVPST